MATQTQQPLIGHKSHNGARDKKNDDRYAYFAVPGRSGTPAHVLIVADGVTSGSAGEQASQIAVDIIKESLRSSSGEWTSRINEAVRLANERILRRTEEHPEWKGMSTTLVLAAIDGDRLHVAHLGDSRAYLIRPGAGTAHQLTKDHTWVQEALDEGRLSMEEVKSHPNRHVIRRYLGIQKYVDVDHLMVNPNNGHPPGDDETTVGENDGMMDKPLQLQPGDAILLCSDGLTDKVTGDELYRTITSQRGNPEKAVDQLVNMALQREEPDNITGLLFELPGGARAVPAWAQSRVMLAGMVVLVLFFAFVIYSFMAGGGAPDAPDATELASVNSSGVAGASGATAVTPATPIATPSPAATATSVTDEADESSPGVAAQISPTYTATPTSEQTPAASSTAVVAAGGATAVAIAPASAGGDAPTATALPFTSTPAPSPTLAPTDTPIPTATPQPTSTSTATPTSTAPPTATPTTPTEAQPTFSLFATPTATILSVPGPVSNPTPNTSSDLSVVLVNPPASQEVLQGRVDFQWRPNGELGDDQAYELVFWLSGGDPMRDGRSPSVSTTETQLSIDLDSAANEPSLRLQDGQSFRWGVLLVQVEPAYNRIKSLASGNSFIFKRSGGGSSSDENQGQTRDPGS